MTATDSALISHTHVADEICAMCPIHCRGVSAPTVPPIAAAVSSRIYAGAVSVVAASLQLRVTTKRPETDMAESPEDQQQASSEEDSKTNSLEGRVAQLEEEVKDLKQLRSFKQSPQARSKHFCEIANCSELRSNIWKLAVENGAHIQDTSSPQRSRKSRRNHVNKLLEPSWLIASVVKSYEYLQRLQTAMIRPNNLNDTINCRDFQTRTMRNIPIDRWAEVSKIAQEEELEQHYAYAACWSPSPSN
ncbi:hypothetical protein O988_00669 [Pseudogymnoascus sp. VKM F-3808]|nr:hypothetical protein O988_00669 [Pseudogymnoascus sp. VKM F-3808]